MGPSWPSASECRYTVGFCVFGEIVGSPCAVTARKEPSLPSSSECSFSVFCVWVRKGPSLRFLSVSFFSLPFGSERGRLFRFLQNTMVPAAFWVRNGPSSPSPSEFGFTVCRLGQHGAVFAICFRMRFYPGPSMSEGCRFGRLGQSGGLPCLKGAVFAVFIRILWYRLPFGAVFAVCFNAV